MPVHSSLIKFPSGRPSFLFGFSFQEAMSLEQTWGPCRTIAFSTSFLPRVLAMNTPALSLLVGSAFDHYKHLPSIQAIVYHIHNACPNISSIYIRIHAEIWNRPVNLYHIFMTLPPLTSQFQFHVVDPQRDFAIRVVKTLDGVVTTARLPLDSICATVLKDLGTLPTLLSLAVAPPLFLSSAVIRSATRDLRNYLKTFCYLKKITFPLELSSALDVLLHEVLTLPQCTELEFTASSSFKLDTANRRVILDALKSGLSGVRHLQRVTLPFDLRQGLTDVLRDIEDLTHVTNTPSISLLQYFPQQGTMSYPPGIFSETR